MYEDVQNSNMLDKQMLNQLVNENVTPETKNKILKTPDFSGVFFYHNKKIKTL